MINRDSPSPGVILNASAVRLVGEKRRSLDARGSKRGVRDPVPNRCIGNLRSINHDLSA